MRATFLYGAGDMRAIEREKDILGLWPALAVRAQSFGCAC